MATKAHKQNFLVCLYLSCLASTLAPAIETKPQNGINKGQPEMQQAMDNNPEEKLLVKGLEFPPSGDTGYPVLLTQKTTLLLAEALHMLNRVKSLKERRWLETFIQRLGNLAALLEKSANLQEMSISLPTNQFLQTTPPNVTQEEQAQLLMKYPMMPPKDDDVSRVNHTSSSKIQIVTTPPAIPVVNSVEEDDELVEELKEESRLNHGKIAVQRNTAEQQVKAPENKPAKPEITSPITPIKETKGRLKEVNLEKEKAELKEKLYKKAIDLKKMGATQEDIINLVKDDNPHFAGANELTIREEEPEKHNSNLRSSSLIKTEGVTSESYMDISNELSKQNSIQKFEHNHFNLPNQKIPLQRNVNPYNYYIPRQIQSIPNGYKGMLQNHIKPVYSNLLAHNQMELLKTGMIYKEPSPVLQGQYWKAKPQNQFYNKQILLPNYLLSNYSMNPKYIENINYRNASIQHNIQKMKTDKDKFASGNKIDNHLSDEMERQLRAGKIIVLSDSVVRANFGSDLKKENKISEQLSKNTTNSTQN